MVNRFILTFSKAILAVLFLFVIPSTGLSQMSVHGESTHEHALNGRYENSSVIKKMYGELAESNSLSIDMVTWKKYFQKTMLMLEKVDQVSFLNYIVLANDGNFDDNDYFLEYIYVKYKKNLETLIVKIGKGEVTQANVMTYFSSLQPEYTTFYRDFKRDKGNIIDRQNVLRQGGGAPLPVPFNCGSPCTNPGFESGTGFWDYWDATACMSSSQDPCSLVPGIGSQHTIQTAGNDLVVGAALPRVPPGGGTNTMMLGNGSTSGNGASRASISFTVSAANANFSYRYAVVLQDPGSDHTDPERPYFNVRLRDASGAVVPCGDYSVMARPPIVGFTQLGTTDIYYRNWTSVFVPLSAYIGQCVTIQFTSSDCTAGGHYGYAYIDGDCDPLEILASSPAICGGNSVTLTAPTGGASYAWTNTSAGGTTGIVGSTTGQTAVVNAGGTYQCVITSVSGASCTTTLNITVGTSPANPVASFTSTAVCSGTPTAFTDTSTPSGSVTAWSWDFDADGTPDDVTQNPTHVFPSAGTFPVTLTVSMGPCNATVTQNITVNPGVSPAITPAGPFCVNAAAVTLSATPTGGTWGGTGITNTTTGAFDPASATVGNNVISYTVGGACPGTVTSTVVVNPLPVSNAGTDVTICSGVAASIGTAASGSNTYAWLPATGLSNAAVSNPSITTVNSGTTPIVTNYTVTTTASGCSTTDVVIVTVNPQPVLTITNPPGVCSPNTVDITPAAVTAGSTGGGVLTYWSDAAGTVALPSPTALTAGTYYIKVTATGGCTDIDPVTVTINPLPVSNAGTDVTICSGTAASIGTAATAGNGYSWLPTTGLSNAAVSDPSITTVNSGTTPIVTTYTVTTTVTATGCSTVDSVLVTVNPQPVLAITNPAAVCFPGTVDITAAAVTAGSTGGGVLTYWTDAGATSALAGPTAVATSGTYYIKVTATGGCTDIDPVTVTINPLPVSDAGTDVTICTGTAATIGVAAVAGNNYAWLPATGLSAANVSNPGITTTNPGTAPIVTTYTVTTTVAATGCQSVDSVLVTVNPFPVLATTDPAAVCFPGTVDITAAAVTAGTVGSGVYTYWTDAAATNPLATPTAVGVSGTYYIKLVSGAGCSDVDSVVVTINPLPVSNAGPDLVICTGSSGPIGAAGVAGNDYLWSPATGLTPGVTDPNPTVTLTNLTLFPVSSDYYVTTTTVATGCVTSDTVTVTVNPVATANAGSSQSVCSGSSIALGGAVGGSASGGTWSGGAGTYAPDNTTLNAVYTPSAAEYAAGSVTLTLTTDDPAGPCTFASSSVTFFFYENPVVNFTVDDPSGCPVHCVSFTDLSTVGGGDNLVSWNWTFGDGSPDSTSQNTSHCYTLTGFYDVTLTVVSNHGCATTLTNTHMVQVFAVPIADFTPTPQPATVLDPEITLNNASSSDVTYWNYYFGDGDSISPLTPSPVHMYPDGVANQYMGTLIVHNADGCWDTIHKPILIGPEFTFFIPNAFTPNGDGVNDYFFGQGIGIEEYDIYIFDRWGNMIYHGDNIYASMWDGKANNGAEQAQQDVYVWKVKLKDVFGKNHNYIGTVTLVK